MNVIRQAKRGGGNPAGGSRPYMAASQKPKGRGRGVSDFELIQYRPGQRASTSTSSSGDMRTPSNLQLQMAIRSSAHRFSSSLTETNSGNNNLSTPSAYGFSHSQRPTHARSSSISGGNTSSSAVTPRYGSMGPPKTPQASLFTPRNSVIVSSTPRTTPTSASTGCDTQNSRVILAVTEGRGHARGEVGLAVIDIKRPRLILCQLSDRQTYADTLTKISVFQPIEILVPHTFVDSNQPNKLYKLLEEKFPFVSMTKVQRRLYRDSEGLEKVQHLCLPEYSSCQLILQEKFYALAAAAALVKYIEFVQNVIFAANSLKVEYQGAHHGTLIDVKTAKNLELLLNQQSNNATHTLVSIMDHCCTHGGSRLLRASLLHPPCSLPIITQRQDGVQELVENPDIALKIREVMQQLPDVEQLLTLCMQTPSTIDTTQAMETRVNYVLMLKTTVETLPLLIAAIEKAQSILLCKAKMCLQDPRSDLMKTRIVQTLNEDVKAPKGGKTAMFQKCFAVKSGINELMDVARKTYCELINDMHEHVLELGDNHSLLLKMNYSVTKGYHIQIPIQKSRPIKKSDLPPLFVQVQQSRNSLTCTTDTLIHANERIKYVTTDIMTMSNTVLTVILNDIREHIGYLYEMCESIAEVDLILALAQTSRSHNYVRPKFGEILSVKLSRHPILESITACDPIANDIEASSWQNLSIVTGPNMSGKSIYIRQVLLLQIMAQVGCYVPAEDATFRITDRIFSHLNFDDSIENNASTLSLEMQEMQPILSSITATSLVVLDELCRGTSVEEGTAIAWSLCEELSQSTAFVFVTTHYRELTRLSSLYPCIKNIHLETVEQEFSDKKCRLVYTHRLMPGVNPVQDYGVRLAENLDVPGSILQLTADFASKIRSTSEENLTSAQGDETYTLAFALHKLKLIARKENLSVDDLLTAQLEIKEAVATAQQRRISITLNEKKTVVPFNPTIESHRESKPASNQPRICIYSSSDYDSTFSPIVQEVPKTGMSKSVFYKNPIEVSGCCSPKITDESYCLSPSHTLKSQSMSTSINTMDGDDNSMSMIFNSSFNEGASPARSASFCSQHTWLTQSPLDPSVNNRSTCESRYPPHKRMLPESPLDESIEARQNSEDPFLPPKKLRNFSDSSDSECDESSLPTYSRSEPSFVDDDSSHSSSTSHSTISVAEGKIVTGRSFSPFCLDTKLKPANDTTANSSRDFFSLSTVVLSQNSIPANPFHFMNQDSSTSKPNLESLFKNAHVDEIMPQKGIKNQEAFPSNDVSTLTEFGESSPIFHSEITPLKRSNMCVALETNKIKNTPYPRSREPIIEDTLSSPPLPSGHQAPQGSLKSLMDSYWSSDSDGN